MERTDYIYLASNLKALRESNNLSLGQFAIKLGVNRNTYYNWESGKTEPGILIINRIAELYHITVNQLCLQNANTICKL